jgi:hypothetical protein
MASIAVFIRKVPVPLLRRYFASANIPLPESFDWDAPIAKPLLQAIDEIGDDVRATVVNDVQRVAVMSDEAGQTALYGVALGRADLDDLPNGHARALWLYINERNTFRRAEEIRYSDDHRHGKLWEGFVGEPAIELKRDEVAIEAF